MYRKCFLQRYWTWHVSTEYKLKLCDTHLQNVPLGSDHSLDQDTEEEQESLVHGGEIHTNVERQEEHQLDQEAGVDEDVGDAGADPDGHTGGGAPVQGKREPEWGAQQQAWKWENS